MRAFAIIILLCLSPLAVAGTARTEVAVLAALHRVHEDVPGYDLDALRAAIVSLSPDVLCMEISPSDLDERPDEGTKIEYPRVVYPLLDEYEFTPCTLEPPAEEAAAIIKPYVAASRAFETNRSEAAARFESYNEAMYDLLKSLWQSPADVNGTVTDEVLGAKHALQIALIGEGEAAGWNAWNEYFLSRILQASRAHPGKRIVVLVGVEHGYWLRRALAHREEVKLLDTAALLNGG